MSFISRAKRPVNGFSWNLGTIAQLTWLEEIPALECQYNNLSSKSITSDCRTGTGYWWQNNSLPHPIPHHPNRPPTLQLLKRWFSWRFAFRKMATVTDWVFSQWKSWVIAVAFTKHRIFIILRSKLKYLHSPLRSINKLHVILFFMLNNALNSDLRCQ